MRTNEYELDEGMKSCPIRSYHSLLNPQKREYNAHHHTECEISIFLEGEGIYTVGDRCYEFVSGDVFLFGSNEEHCITEIKEPIDLLNIQFEPYLLWEKADTMELLSLFNARNPSFENKFCHESETVGEYLKSIERELYQKRECYVMAVKCSLFMALASIIRENDCIDHNKLVKASDSTTQSLRLAIDYIQQNLESKLTLDEIAAHACVSPTYFSYLFKKFNGISLWEYISIKRVEKAIEMLKSKKMTKLEIAESCGFSSSSNFYKIFTSVTGKSPSYFVKKP